MEHNYYSREDLIEATKNTNLYDYIANHYWEMPKEDLKEVILSLLGVVYDNSGVGASRDEEYSAFEEKVVEELLEGRYFLGDEED